VIRYRFVAPVVVGAAAFFLVSCGGTESPQPTATVSSILTATPDGPPVTTATATTEVRPAATATAGPVLLSDIPGIHTSPQERPPDKLRPLAPASESPFPDHDGESVVLYNIERGTVRNLGPGMLGVFSADGRYMAWNDLARNLWYIELPDGEPIQLGEGGGIIAVEGAVVAVYREASADQWDLSTETSTPVGPRKRGEPQDYQGSYALSRDYSYSPAGEFVITVESTAGEVWTYTGAHGVEFAGPGELALATKPRGGISNLFTLDIESAAATFIATTGARLDAVGFAANERWIVWTTDFCAAFIYPISEGQGTTRVLDRSTGTIYDLGVGLWPEGFAPDGRLGIGWSFGALALIDLDEWAYDVVLPAGSVDVNWSPDYRYASRGAIFGHGGVCTF
jgi:hypothetical protein